jgi:hypothetical protein
MSPIGTVQLRGKITSVDITVTSFKHTIIAPSASLFAAMIPHTFLDDALQRGKIFSLSNSFKVTKMLILLDGRRPLYTVIPTSYIGGVLSLPHSCTSLQEDSDLTVNG